MTAIDSLRLESAADRGRTETLVVSALFALLAVATTALVIYGAYFGLITALILRSAFFSMVSSAGLLFVGFRAGTRWTRYGCYALAAVALVPGLHLWQSYMDIIMRGAMATGARPVDLRRADGRGARAHADGARLVARRPRRRRPALRLVRLPDPRQVRPRRLRPAPPRLDADALDGRRLRPADGRGGRIHLPVRAARHAPDEDRHGRGLRRSRARPHRARPGRPRPVGRAVELAPRHDQRQRRRQRGDDRHLHDPADEAGRLHARARRRDRGGGLLGGPDPAAGHGRGGLPDGRDHRRPLRPDRARGARAGAALRRGADGGGAPRGRPPRPCPRHLRRARPAARDASQARLPADPARRADRLPRRRLHADPGGGHLHRLRAPHLAVAQGHADRPRRHRR